MKSKLIAAILLGGSTLLAPGLAAADHNSHLRPGDLNGRYWPRHQYSYNQPRFHQHHPGCGHGYYGGYPGGYGYYQPAPRYVWSNGRYYLVYPQNDHHLNNGWYDRYPDWTWRHRD